MRYVDTHSMITKYNVSLFLPTIDCLTFFAPCSKPQLFEERSKEHLKYGGDPTQPHKLHIVIRVKSTKRRPYWEKKLIKDLGLEKVTLTVSLHSWSIFFCFLF